ncbi:MAG: hypothetical protein EZS28_034816, partial [Streblomastix strix]
QINPTATSYDGGLRISRSATEPGNSQIQLGCSRTSNTGLIEGQWSIFTPSNTAISNSYRFVIAVTSQAGENNRGLQISADGNTLTFNGNGLFDVGTDQTIIGIIIIGKFLQVIPTIDGTINEGIRISRNQTNQWSNIQFGGDPNSNSRMIDNQWMIGILGNNAQNPLRFTIVKAGQEDQIDRGFQISTDGNTLTFNGQVIAGTCATYGSVNYSQDNSILWDVNSTETKDSFYSNGVIVFWRSNALQFDQFLYDQ